MRPERQRTRAPHCRLSSGSRRSPGPSPPADQEREAASLRHAEKRRGGVKSAGPTHEPDPAARIRGRVGEIGNTMGTHTPREQKPRHLSTGLLRRARRNAEKHRPGAARPRRHVAARSTRRARDARDAEARAAAAGDEDSHADEHDESRQGTRAPAWAVARSHIIGAAHGERLTRFDVLKLSLRQAKSCGRDASHPRPPLKRLGAARRRSRDCCRMLTSVSQRRVSLAPDERQQSVTAPDTAPSGRSLCPPGLRCR
jgi:hypothetical protein